MGIFRSFERAYPVEFPAVREILLQKDWRRLMSPNATIEVLGSQLVFPFAPFLILLRLGNEIVAKIVSYWYMLDCPTNGLISFPQAREVLGGMPRSYT